MNSKLLWLGFTFLFCGIFLTRGQDCIQAVATDISVPSYTICSGELIQLEATSSTVENPTFHWYTDESLTQEISLTSFTLVESETLYVTVEGDNVCENIPSNAKAVTITVNQLPSITINGSTNRTANVGQHITLPSFAEGNTGVTWYTPNGSALPSSSVTITSQGIQTFTAVKTNSSGCSTATYYTVTGVSQNANATASFAAMATPAADCPLVNDRTYGTSATPYSDLLSSVSNSGQASDGNPMTSATLSTTLGLLGLGTVALDVNFDATYPAGTAVTVKLGKQNTAVNLLPSIRVYGVSNGSIIGSGDLVESGLLSLLSAESSYEYTFVPTNNLGPQSFDAIRVVATPVLSVAANIQVFEAYVNSQVSTLACSTFDANVREDVQDVSYGVAVELGLDALSATASVTTPWLAVDPNLLTYAQLNRGVAVLNTAVLDVSFKAQSQVTDSLQVIVSRPDNSLLQLGLLNGFQVQLYLGDVAVGAPITNNSEGLNLQLLGLLGGAGSAYAMTIPTPLAFDRVVITYGGVANVLDAIQVYDVSRIAAVETVVSLNADGVLELCAEETIQLVQQDDCTWFELYDASNNLLTSSDNFEFEVPAGLTAAQTYTFYVQPIRQGCAYGDRQELEVYIEPSAPVDTFTTFSLNGGTDAFACESSTPVTLSVTPNSSYTFTNPIYSWYEMQEGVAVLITGENAATLDLGILPAGDYTYYVGISSDEYCETLEADRFEINFTINPTALATDVSVTGDAICNGETAQVFPTSSYSNVTYTWYYTNDYTSPIINGDTDGAITYALDGSGMLEISGLATANDGITYYVSISGGDDTVCENAVGDLTPVSITVTDGAVVPTTTQLTQNFCVVDAATVADLQVNESNIVWYNQDTGGVAYTDTDVLTNGIYYAAQEIGSCVSTSRLAVTVAIDDTATPTASETTQQFCEIDSPTLASIIVNETNIVWYDAATGGTVLTEDTLLTDGGVYYAAQVGASCESSTRLAITTVINASPVLTLSSNATNVGLNDVVTLPTVTTEPSGLTVTWYDQDGALFTGTTTSFTTPGLYAFTAITTNAAGCSSTAAYTIAVFDQDACPPASERTYATSSDWTGLGGFITNASNGSDGNPKTSATITTVVGLAGLGGGYYDMFFDQEYPAGTAVSVKMGKEYSGVGALSGFLVYGLDSDGDAIGAGNSADAGLINLLSADGTFELTFVPSNSTGPQAFSGVRVYFGSLLSVADSYNVYGSYVTEQNTTLSCTGIDSTVKPDVQDVYYGVEVLLGLDALSATASVVDPWLAVDFDDELTYAQLNRGAAVLNRADLSVEFKSQSQPTDSLRIVLSRPDNALLQLGLLNGFEIQLYLGDSEVGAPITNSTSGLSLQLLGLLGGSGQGGVLTVPTPDAYDKVLISYGGVANVIDAIRIHDVDRKATVETVETLIDGELSLCGEETIALVQQDDCTWYEVYDASNNLLTSTDNFEFELPSGLAQDQTYTFYVQPVRQGCAYGARQELVVYIQPSSPVDTFTSFSLNGGTDAFACESSTPVTLSVTPNSSYTFTNPVYSWYELQDGGAVLVTGESDATLNLGVLPAGDYTYYIGISSDEYCETLEADRFEINFTINPTATATDVSVTGDVICNGGTAQVFPTSTYSNVTYTWYYTNDTTLPITTGDTSGALAYTLDGSGMLQIEGLTLADDGITYYVSIAGGTDDVCENATGDLTAVSITVTDSAVVPTTAQANQNFCVVEGATVADLQVNETNIVWYNQATGGTAYASTDLLSTGIYYAAQEIGSCVSASRLAVNVAVEDTDVPTTTNTTQEFCEVDTPTIASIAINETNIAWYDAATGGTALTEDTLLTDGGVYYAAQVGASCESSTRLAITTTINASPVITLSSNSTNVGLNDVVTLPTATTEPAGLTVTWYDQDGAVFTGSTTSFATPGIYAFTAIATNSVGCTSSTVYTIAVFDQDACPPASARTYATSSNFSSLLSFITNEGNGVDGSPKTHATITTVLGLLNLHAANYDLFFDEEYAAGTPVSVKLGKEYSGLGALSGILVYGLDSDGNTIGTGNTVDSGLVNLLSADGAYEFTFVPSDGSGPQNFSGVRIRTGSLLSLADSYNVYGAYVTEQSTTLSCDPIDSTVKPDVQDVYYGVDVLLGLDALSATASVVDPWLAVDHDEVLTYALLNRGAAVLNRANLTVEFKSQSQPTDSLRIVLSRPDNAVLQLGLLNGFEIQMYLGDAEVGQPITNTSEGVNLQLLYLLGGSGEENVLTVPTPEAYDRVTISYGGVANVIDGIRIHDVDRIAAVETVDPLNIDGELELCYDDTIRLTQQDDCTWFEVYDESNNLLANVDAYEFELPTNLVEGQTYTFTVQPIRQGCAYGPRQELLIYIRETTPASVIASIQINGDTETVFCETDNTNITLTAVTDGTTLTNPTYYWYQLVGGAQVYVSGETDANLDLGILPAGTYTYYVGVSSDEYCETKEEDRASITFDINEGATATDIADVLVNGQIPNTPFCLLPTDEVILSTMLSSTSTITNPVFTWYDEAGDMVTGGANGVLNLGILAPGTYTYYVGVSGDGVCENIASERKSVTFTINDTATEDDLADVLVNGTLPTDPYCLLPGDEITLTAALSSTSTITNPVFAWYDEAGNPVVGGTDGILNLGVLTPGTYTYSVGVSGDGYCENLATDRKSVTFTINEQSTATDIADILVNGQIPSGVLCIAATDEVILSTMLSSISTITNPVFAWYDEAGNPIAGGTDGTLNLGVLAPGTYTYSVGVSGDGYCENLATDRKTVTFTINYQATEDDLADVLVNGTLPTDPYCLASGEEVILTAMLSSTSTITNPVFAWYDEAGNPVAGGTDGILNLGVLAPGTYTYSVGVSGDGYCENIASDRKFVTFTINNTATEADIEDITVNGIVPTMPLCLAPGEEVILSTMLTATSMITNPVFAWYDEADNPITGGTDGTLNLGVLAPGTYTYSVGVSGDGYCENDPSDRKSVTFTINPNATAADIMVDDVTVCYPDDAMVTPSTTITNPTFMWYATNDYTTPISDGDIDGAITYAIATDGTITITGLDANTTYTYYVSVSGDGYCENAEGDLAAVTIQVNDPATPTTNATTQTFCAIDTPTIADIQVNETNVVWYDAATGGTLLDSTTPLVDGGMYYAALVENGCESSIRLEVTVVISDLLPPTTTNTDQIFCVVDEPTVADIQVNETNVIWYDAATGGNVIAPTTPLVDGMSYYAALTDGTCESMTRLMVNVTVDDEATPTTNDTTQEFCLVDMPTVADIQVNETNVIWYDAATGGNVIDPTTPLVDGMFYYAALQGANCESSVRLMIVISVEDIATPTTNDTTQEFCLVDMPTVADVQVNETNVIWYDAATGGNVIDPTTPLALGTTMLYAALQGDACESSTRLEITAIVTDEDAPTANETKQEFCLVDMPTVADLETNETPVNWYDAPTGGNLLDPATPLISGEFYYGAYVGTTCESSTRIEIEVEILDTDAPTAIATTQFFCDFNMPTVGDIEVIESNIVWYDAEFDGNVIDPTTPLVDGMTYYAAQVGIPCESSVRLAITVFITDDTAEIEGEFDGICIGETYTYTTDPMMNSYTWTVTGGTIIDGGDLADNYVTVTWDELGDNSIEVSYSDPAGCTASVDGSLTVTVVSCSDLVITKEVSNETPAVNEVVSFTIDVYNNGTTDFTNIVVTDMLPSGYTYVSHSVNQGTYDETTGVWTIPSLLADETATMVIDVSVNYEGDYLNIATIETSNPLDSDPSNNTDEAFVDVECLIVYNEFSPNNDGANDTLVIQCIEEYPDNNLKIFNRYGNLLYEADGYLNTWDGKANVSGVFREGEDLPVGTYYYVLEVPSTKTSKAGWIYLAR